MVAKKSVPLTKPEAFYIEAQNGKMSAADIGRDIKRPAKVVQKYIDELAEAGVVPAKPATPPSLPEKAGFATKGGVTCQTAASSEKGDDMAKRTVNGNDFMKAHDVGIHIIDPTRPVT